MTKRLLPLIATALITTSVLFLQSLFSGTRSSIKVGVVFAVILLLVVVGDFAQRRLVPTSLAILRPILNSCARVASEITTVASFLTESDEECLENGDEVHVLTNSLKGYDMTPPAVKVIGDNLRDGVRYLYYLPDGDDYPTFETEKDSFVSKVASASGLSAGVVDKELNFFLIREPCIYNFAAVVRVRSGGVAGYWYVTTPAPPRASSIEGGGAGGGIGSDPNAQGVAKASSQRIDYSNPSLVILKLDRNDTGRLWKLLHNLRRSARQISAVAPGLQPVRKSPRS